MATLKDTEYRNGELVTGFVFDNVAVPVPSAASFSVSYSAETRARREIDGTHTSQATAVFRKPVPANYTFTFNIESSLHGDVLQYIQKYEDTVGKSGGLFYSGYPFGDIIIESVTIGLVVDTVAVVESANVSITFRENTIVSPQTSKINVRF
jgi:hypothetical protein